MSRWQRIGVNGWVRAIMLAWWPLLTCSYLYNPQPVGLLAEVLVGVSIVCWLRERHQQRKRGRSHE